MNTRPSCGGRYVSGIIDPIKASSYIRGFHALILPDQYVLLSSQDAHWTYSSCATGSIALPYIGNTSLLSRRGHSKTH